MLLFGSKLVRSYGKNKLPQLKTPDIVHKTLRVTFFQFSLKNVGPKGQENKRFCAYIHPDIRIKSYQRTYQSAPLAFFHDKDFDRDRLDISQISD